MDVISIIRKKSGGHCFVAGLDKTVAHSPMVEDPLFWRSEYLHYSGEQRFVPSMEIIEVKTGW